MENSNSNVIIFPIEWTVKSTAYSIRFRKAFNINQVDESFCTILNAKGGQITIIEFGNLLGFYLEDLAEIDILNNYLNNLCTYDLIKIEKDIIFLTDYGKEALQSKLKYKYFSASVELFENQTADGEDINFSYKDSFGLDNKLNEIQISENLKTLENPDLKSKLQFQLFKNDIYKGEVVEIFSDKSPALSYRSFDLQCRTTFLQNTIQLNFLINDSGKFSLDQLIEKTTNRELKEELIRKGKFHFLIANNKVISAQHIKTYLDLCDWKELAKNPKVEWSNKQIFELFKENGDGSIWKQLSENVSIENIKAVIRDFDEYWNWSVLTQRLDNTFIKEEIHNFNWDFEELSFKETDFVIDLLSDPTLKDRDWDWNYLSQNLTDDFIEENILDYNWDFHIITIAKNEIFKNVFRKHSNSLERIIGKSWDWEYISKEINVNFLFKNVAELASKIVWPIAINQFFNNEKIINDCLKEESFKSLLKENVPSNYRVAHQKYIWSLKLIDFLEELNLINWETTSYIKGFDTNEEIEWNKEIFTKYQHKISTDKGFANVSKHLSAASLIGDFPNFSWDWEGISKNNYLIGNIDFIKNAISGKYVFADNLFWDEIYLLSSYDISFWNQHLEVFHSSTNSEAHSRFWHLLTQQEENEYIFLNSHFPWDWRFVTESTSTQTILESLEDEELISKWDWEIVTRKLDKITIDENWEALNRYIDWSFIIENVFTVENELRLGDQLPRVAACLSILEDERKRNYWKVLTAVYPFAQLFEYVEETYKLKEFEWDWDLISNHNHFPPDLRTINEFKNHLSWSIFSVNKSIIQKFDFSNWDSFREWFKSTDSYLLNFSDYWDWRVLSQNESLTYNRLLLTKYKNEEWDWEYLSEFAGFLKKQKKDKVDYLENIIKSFPKISFEFLSKRMDIKIDSRLILSTKDKDWNWQILSENEKAEISNEILLNLKDKNWNWEALSKRKDIEISNDTLLHLIDKDWNWQVLSQNANLLFNAELIEKTKSKPWNWKIVSRNKSFFPNNDMLSICKDFNIDWSYISQRSDLNPSRELLSKFENNWDWQMITKNQQINLSDIGFLERFIDKWDWDYICRLGNLPLNNKTLTLFKKHLNWNLISANSNINFTTRIIQEFRPYWNWTTLRQNKRVEELLGDYVANEIENSAILSFLDKIEQQCSPWKGHIYHFSHIDNAVQIIKNRKIQSRNNAIIKGDSAGDVVHLRNDAHDYSRFYFRPHTPTQFYNEFLGKNTTDGYDGRNGWVSWYERARGLGFPKCPIPIFFRFSLQEILFKYDNRCCVSNGNMQTRSTMFGGIEEMIDKFGFDDLFYTPAQYATKEDYNRYRNYAQQEFLVNKELDFSNLTNIEIVCSSDADRTLLINLLGQEQKNIFSKIVVDNSYYNRENPRIKVDDNEDELHISTNFSGEGFFVLNGSDNMKELEVLSGDLNSLDNDAIIFKSHISIENKLNKDITLRFIDESNRDWFVYSTNSVGKQSERDVSLSSWGDIITGKPYNPKAVINLLKQNGFYETFSHKVRHYTLESHTILVCNVFEQHFANDYSHVISLELFRTLLILHDIGKTEAFVSGNKNNQYICTQRIIKELWKNLPYSEKERMVIFSLLDGDYLGEYFQGRLSLEPVHKILINLANQCNLQSKLFFKLYMIYYQCDIASYTADAGGLKFLEYLFSYENESKVFDDNEGLLRFSAKYLTMYSRLKQEIENGD